MPSTRKQPFIGSARRDFQNPQSKSSRVVRLTKMGLANETIAKKVGLPIHVVKYRQKLAGVRVTDWRKGKSPEVKYVINAMDDYIDRQVADQLRKQRLLTP